jgi:hypothetical protein
MSTRAVRVDNTGTVHPIGRAASQELRAKTGEWRLAPGAHDVLLIRSARPDAPGLRLCGEVKVAGGLCDIVALAAQSSWTGELVLVTETSRRVLFLDSGTVIGVQTDVAAERIGETLYRFGLLTQEQVANAVRQAQDSGKRVGEVAVELGYITTEQLYSMMTRQVEEVFQGAIQEREGTFYFFDRFEERAVGVRQNVPAGQLLFEAARRTDEMRFFRDKIPSGAYVPVPTHGTANKVPEECARVFAACDGKRTVDAVGRVVGMLEFDVTRSVFQLVNAGCVYMKPPRPRGAGAIVAAFNPALVAVHRRCDAAGKGGELRDGLGRFAMGAGVFEPLFMGAGPKPDGTLEPAAVARNLGALAGEDPDAWLIQQLNDYVGFAVFQAGSLVARVDEEKLAREIAEILKPVRPNVDDELGSGMRRGL